MTSSNSKIDGIDDYSESVWRNLGHPAFDDEYYLALGDIEWWDIEEERERE